MTTRTLTIPVATVLTAAATLLPITACDLLDSESEPVDTIYPMYVDEDGNGRYDHWEPGGRGHGGPHTGPGRMGGMNAGGR